MLLIACWADVGVLQEM